ncbi:MAG: hypothetical protein ACYS6W_04365 [Planctomycetota bacterium]|jgi:di/tricarboxylate transporter
MEDEICENCGGIISPFEQAFVYQGRIVCEKCDKKLRGEPPKIEELLEFPELQASPVKIPKPLPHKRRRSRITRSMILSLLLSVWSFLSLFLIFYVPPRYESELKGNTFGVECLIVSFMVLWFLGALVLFIAITFTQKDEKLKSG